MNSETEAIIKANCERFLRDDGSWLAFYRSIIDYSDSGASMGVLLLGSRNPVYCDHLRSVASSALVTTVYLSAIVEGVDRCTKTHVVSMAKPNAISRFDKALQAVDEEAGEIWDETHGCDSCAEHFGINRKVGYSPIWDGCPSCHGVGTVI